MKDLMKKKFALLFVLFGLLAGPVLAQDEEAITDKDLWKYAMMEAVIQEMINDISAEVNSMIKAQEGIDGRRFKELNAAKGDQGALDALGAQEFEIKFLELVNELKSDRIEAIKLVKSELAKKMMGERGKVYKRIEDGLKTDDELKARYKEFEKQIEFIDLDSI